MKISIRILRLEGVKLHALVSAHTRTPAFWEHPESPGSAGQKG
jgi:hypothetical protein